MSESGSRGGAESSGSANGISHFLGKVLNQLSLTSWMPAGMLVGVGALLISLHGQIASDPLKGFDLGGAVATLTENTLGTAVVLLVAVILAATITQAFSFGAIRLLEGYWDGRGLSGRLLRWRTAVWLKRRVRLEARATEQWRAAFEGARVAMRNAGIVPASIAALEDRFNGALNIESTYALGTLEQARQLSWQAFAPPALLHSAERSNQHLKDFPSPHRVLPTKLGNVIRSREDALVNDGYDLEGFVMRRYANVKPRLLAQHDDFRTRLDMYCTFVPVFLILAIMAAALLAWPGGHYLVATPTALGLLGLSVLSYRAAVASARGYGAVLSAISTASTEPDSTS